MEDVVQNAGVKILEVIILIGGAMTVKKKFGEVLFEKIKSNKGGMEKGKVYLLTAYKNKIKN